MVHAEHDYSIKTDYYNSELAKDPKWRSHHLVLVRCMNEYGQRIEIIPWMQSVNRQIAAQKTYQSFAKLLEVANKPIVVCCSVDEFGVLSNAHIWQSSRDHSLDQKAIKLVTNELHLQPPSNNLPCVYDIAIGFTPGLPPQSMVACDAKSALLEIEHQRLSNKPDR